MTIGRELGSTSDKGQGEVRSEVRAQISKEQLIRKELVSRANKVLLLFAERAIPALREDVREGKGKQAIVSTQEGRPGEELLRIDQPAEGILQAAIRETHLPAVLFSETTPEPTEFKNGGDVNGEKFYVFADPFDNSSPYKRGLDIPPYTVVSIWDKEGQPIGAVVGDIERRKAYVSMNGETFVWDLEKKSMEKQAFGEWEKRSLKDHIRLLEKKIQIMSSNPDQIKELFEIENQITELNKSQPESQERSSESIAREKELQQKRVDLIGRSPELKQLVETNKQIADIKDKANKNKRTFDESQTREPERKIIMRSDRTTVTDRESTLASFLGENEYSIQFFQDFKVLVGKMHKKGYLYPGGGAFIYGLLASGAIDAYVMRNEPFSEIIPGLPLALTAGCTVVAVDEKNGSYQDFKFNPVAMQEDHRLYSDTSIAFVPLLIAAATPEIRDEIIKHFMETKKAEEEKFKTQKLNSQFAEERGQEFEIFRASKHQPENSTGN